MIGKRRESQGTLSITSKICWGIRKNNPRTVTKTAEKTHVAARSTLSLGKIAEIEYEVLAGRGTVLFPANLASTGLFDIALASLILAAYLFWLITPPFWL